MEELNPYASPKAEVLVNISDAEKDRRDHISHEASIKSLGCLYVLLGTLLLIGAISTLVTISTFDKEKYVAGAFMTMLGRGVLLFVVAFVIGSIGLGLRKLKGWAGIMGGIIAGISVMLSMPGLPMTAAGMLIPGYVLWLLVSKKGRRVTSPDYQTVIAQTPHVKLHTSLVVWILLGLLLIALTFAIYSVVTSR
jgi:hypothetical protein